jgi:signal transduction histidine kinase
MTDVPDARRRPGLERFTVTRWFALVVGGLIVVAAAGLVIGVVALSRLSDRRDLLADEIDPAVLAAERFETALVNEETGVRGYALSSDRAFLPPYRRGRREENRALARLGGLGRNEDLAQLRTDVARARAAAAAWRTEYAAPTLRAVAALRLAPDPGEGRRRFDAVRATIADMQSHLTTLRGQARRDLDRAADVVLVLFLAAGALLLITVLAAALALRSTIVAPLARLAGDVRRVAGGDFTLALKPSGPREIASLGRDVEGMRVRIVSEVTALRDAEAALSRQAGDLERSNRELEQFAYVASHDLQEPLRKVASFTQMLQRRYEGQLDERADRYIEFAVDGAKRMQALINDLLAFSRVGRVTNPHGRVDTGALVAQAAANLSTLVDAADAVVEAGTLPEVDGDAALLSVVFQNLIANAVKFRAPDRAPRVRIEADQVDGDWRFAVTDNGIGVEPEYAERIFVIFQRLHTRTAYEGTGIGLAMCRKIIEYHGGRIWLGDAPADGGSRFYFTLPAVDEEESA